MIKYLKCTHSVYEAFQEGEWYEIYYHKQSKEQYIISNDGINYFEHEFTKFPEILTDGEIEFQEVLPIEPQPMTHNTPNHYNLPIEPIDYINALNLNFNLGNVIKYVSRAGKKMGESQFSDLLKARDYINFELERIAKDE